MSRIIIINNGGQWTHRIWRVIGEIEKPDGTCHEAEILPNTTPLEQIEAAGADGLILSGGAPSIATEAQKLGLCGDYLDNFKKPILGLCIGHQFMALHFGGDAGPAAAPEYGLVGLEVIEPGELLKGLPTKFNVWGNHNDEVKSAPGFKTLAKSANCINEAIQHESLPLYGLQFHPEVNDTQYGDHILANFVEICGGAVEHSSLSSPSP